MTQRPSSPATPRYSAGEHGAHGDARLSSGVFDRANPGLCTALAPLFGALPGTVLEIGCGTGQNAAAFAKAFPALRWVASDPFPEHRASALAWAAHLRVTLEVLPVDASENWGGMPEIRALGPLSAVFASNVAHITPWAVTAGLLAGAAERLARGGLVILAGPFKVHGDWIGPGNEAFDTQLRAENADWGIRDLSQIEAEARPLGLTFHALSVLPANNRLIVLRKA
ncbi:DUF938 domain-containing protein [Anianabacter salinae]|uniref:DUF938 domain-containing protein n=1 Tax=Anianabacter salinae TaxID=2851023 RepID=UPI00225E3755|nr:DUF938 domain-containing protein [Anianabacter salinae]MBV0911504.1 DUF938 domain-containing protein [Anianabacter salinae]